MYHIKDDKRAHQSAALLCAGLAGSLEEKPYKEISITEVCASCGVARTTFYRLFDTLDDVLLYQFDALFEKALRKRGAKEPDGISYAKLLLDTVMQDKALTAAIVSSGRNDLFDFAARAKENAILRELRLDIGEGDRLYCTPMLNAMAAAVLRTWAVGGCRESADELYESMRRNIKRIDECM